MKLKPIIFFIATLIWIAPVSRAADFNIAFSYSTSFPKHTRVSLLSHHGEIVRIGGVFYWRPFVSAGWEPFSNGHFHQHHHHNEVWVSYDPWGEYTDHYGYWRQHAHHGWVWRPFHKKQWHPHGVSFYWHHGKRYHKPFHKHAHKKGAYRRGYRNGFSDGFQHGWHKPKHNWTKHQKKAYKAAHKKNSKRYQRASYKSHKIRKGTKHAFLKRKQRYHDRYFVKKHRSERRIQRRLRNR